MIKNKKIFFLFIIFLVFIVSTGFYLYKHSQAGYAEQLNINNIEESEDLKPEFRFEKIEIIPGDTFTALANRAGLSSAQAQAIYDCAYKEYDLAKIKAGNFLELLSDYETGEIKEIIYKIDNEEELVVIPDRFDGYSASCRSIAYDVKIVTKQAEINNSLYLSALEIGMDEKAVIELAEAFQWTIDFAMDPRVGDTFKVIYEEKYINDEYVRPGKILAARYVNNGISHELYYFSENEDNEGYFDETGNSVQKMFLKAPVAFKYISSGFTTGSRYIEAFNVSTGHRAIDYAAPIGTPIRSVGDGTIISAAWSGSYGNMVSVRHNSTYTTNYAHMSKMVVRYGQKVKQGDIIGYVGSTGFSTGPHLHYEMVRNGIKVNPLIEILPPGTAIKEENKERFFDSISNWQDQLRDEVN